MLFLTKQLLRKTNAWRRLCTAVLAVSVFFTGLKAASAQEGGGPNGTGSAPATAKPGAANPNERLVYIPYQQFKLKFGQDGASVFLPYGEFLKLWEQAFGSALRPADKPPVGAVISTANYVGTVEQDLVRIKATFAAKCLDKPWSEVPLKFGDAAIGKLTSDSGKVLLRGTGQGTYQLLLPTVGDHQIELELTTRVRSTPEGKSIEFDVPPVGITNFELVVPEGGQAIDVSPRLAVVPQAGGAATESRIKANLGATEKIGASWHAKVGARPELELLASASNHTLVSMEDGLVHTATWLTYDVLRGQIEKVRLAVPKGQRILDITSDAKVKEWKAVDEADRQVVTVELLSRVEKRLVLEVHTERAIPVEPFDVVGMAEGTAYGVHALDVLRESGQLAVRSASDLTLTVEQQTGAARIDEGEVDPRLKHPGSLYFRFYSPQLRLKTQVKPVEPRLLVNHTLRVEIHEDQLKARSQLGFQIERAGLFELKLRVPEGVTVENVVCDRMKQYDVHPETRLLTIALNEKTSGAVEIYVFLTQPRTAETEASEQKLPVLEPVGVELENGRLAIYAPDSLEVITNTERLLSAQPDANPTGWEPIPNLRLVSSWTFNRRPVEIPVRTIRKPTRLTARVGTRVEVKAGQLQVQTDVRFLVEYAGIDTFRIAVPEEVAEKVRIVSTAGGTAPAIKQQSRAEKAVDGWVTWTIIMQRDVLGEQPFQITYDLNTKLASDGRTELGRLPLVRVLDPVDAAAGDGAVANRGSQKLSGVVLAWLTGEATIVKDRALAVTAQGNGGNVEPIDVRELTLLPQDGVAAFRYDKQPVTLELSANKFEIQEMIETIVAKALVAVVVDRAGTTTYQARYQLKSSERQRLRIDLPAGAEPLTVTVDRKPVSLEKAVEATDRHWQAFHVNIARTKSSDEPFLLSLTFKLRPSPAPLETNRGNFALRLPVIGGMSSGAAAAGVGRVATQQLRVAMWVPKEYILVGTPRNFTVESRSSAWDSVLQQRSNPIEGALQGWFNGGDGGLVDFPVEGRSFLFSNLGGVPEVIVTWWHIPFHTWVYSLAILAVAALVRRSSLANRLSLVLLLALVTALVALSDVDLVGQVLAVSVYGIVAGLLVWVIQDLTGLVQLWRQCCRKDPATVSLRETSAVTAGEGSTSSSTPPPSTPESEGSTST